jgi:hypothetical protein
MRSHLQNSQSKMDWRCGSGIEHLQVESPEFKPQAHQKKKKKNSEQCEVMCSLHVHSYMVSVLGVKSRAGGMTQVRP